MTAPVILLHPEDNVVVCRRTVLAGERVIVEGAVDFVAAQDVDVGHKIARVALPSGRAEPAARSKRACPPWGVC